MMPPEDRIQEAQYDFPYHHIPSWDHGDFSPTRHWSWGVQYYAGIQAAMDFLSPCGFESLLDIGCGDGRFLHELIKRYPDRRLRGIDISRRAIDFARAFTPGVTFAVEDIHTATPAQSVDAATLIEVCEHIHPDKLGAFLNAVAAALKPGGTLILTVPHQNKKLSPKHYQHFTEEMLRRILEPRFDRLEFKYFDRRSWLLRALLLAGGGQGRCYIISAASFNRIVFRFFKKFCLYAERESQCQRIACRARVKAHE